MSSHIIDIFNVGETLITLGLDTIIILLKMWLFLMIFSTILAEIEVLEFSRRLEIPKILRYDFN